MFQQLWDLSANKLLADFKSHSKAVMSVQFHHRELLLVSGSADRTVRFYDLEHFTEAWEVPPEASGIRKVLFHPQDKVLFTATDEALKVCACVCCLVSLCVVL